MVFLYAMLLKNKIKWWKCYLAKILMVKSRWTWSQESLWKKSSLSPIKVLTLCFIPSMTSACEDVLHTRVVTHYFGRLVCLKMQSCVSWIKRCQFWGSAGVFWPWSAAHGTESCLCFMRKPSKGQGGTSHWEVGPGKALSGLWNYLSGSYLQ